MRQPKLRLEGKVSIVTGAGSRGPGIGNGKATAILFAREGAKVLLVDRVPDRVHETLELINGEGGEASVFSGDVTNIADCQAMVAAAVERYGRLDILHNNVGIESKGSVINMDLKEWDTVMTVNLKSMVWTCKHAVPAMMTSGGGSIINVSSIDGLRAGFSPNVPYAVAKAGVVQLTRTMAVHHGRDNIRVNCIAPGHLHAPFVSDLSNEVRELRRRAGPLGTEGDAWDVAWAAVFLASNESRWISGVVLPVDAGLLAATPLSVLDNLV